MVQPGTMAFRGKMDITEVETICICKEDFTTKTIITTEHSMTQANTMKEMLQISAIMFAKYTASNDIMSNVFMLQCINFKIWQCWFEWCAPADKHQHTYDVNVTIGNRAKQIQ